MARSNPSNKEVSNQLSRLTMRGGPMAKGIVIIHGMGEQEPGQCLISVANPLADYLERDVSGVNVISQAWIGCEELIPQVQLDIT